MFFVPTRKYETVSMRRLLTVHCLSQTLEEVVDVIRAAILVDAQILLVVD